MTHLEYFKNQAKKLHKDWKLREQKHFAFDIKTLFYMYNVKADEEPTLMKAQHLLALALGRNSWNELSKEAEDTLAYTRKVLAEDYLSFIEESNSKLTVTKDNEFSEEDGYHGEVECLHCGRRFPIDKPNHLPSCDGEDWDLIPVE